MGGRDAATVSPITAVTLDFYDTLARHREGGGRGRSLTEYVQAAGHEPEPWDHRVLYRVFEGHRTAYSPTAPETDRRRYRERLALRAFRELGVEMPEGDAAGHADPVWEILGPAAFALFPEVDEVLGELARAGVPMFIVSNWQSGLVHFVDELGILDYVDGVFSSEDVGFAKPDRRIFDLARERLGAAPAQILHVGDTVLDDYEGSTAAGFQAALVCRGPRPVGFEGRSIGSLSEVARMVGVPS